jgi:hypothetical protein
MRVQVGQLPPATDVRCLIQHPTSGTASRPPGERFASCSAASHNAIARAVSSPAELPCPSLLCTACRRLHERGDCSLQTTRALLSRA